VQVGHIESKGGILRMKRFLIVALALFLLGSLSWAEERNKEGVGLTIYSAPGQGGSGGYAIVKEWRRLNLKRGRNIFKFQDVANLIDPTTVSFKSLTDPENTLVLEQNFEYDLVSTEKLLAKYIDKKIILEKEDDRGMATGRKEATLLSAQGGNVVEMDGQIHLNPAGRIILPELPEGLITRPTLVWLLEADKEGSHLTKVTYETKGLGWHSDYIVIAKEGDRALDLSGWVTIDNKSGATYKDAQLKLVAGDVHRAPEPDRVYERRYKALAAVESEGSGFAEKSFFEYHLYTLGRPSTLSDNSIKQLELFRPVLDVPAKKIFLYYGNPGRYYFFSSPQTDRNLGTQSNKKVDIYLSFKNDEYSGLAIPLPAGRVRVYKEDPDDGSLEFIGEDAIDHTPKDEEVLLKLGSAFDIVGERKQTDFKVDNDRDWMEESFEIALRNHKQEDVEVTVKENLFRWVNWEITENSHPYEKIDSRTIHFKVKAPKDEEVKITYTVKYTW